MPLIVAPNFVKTPAEAALPDGVPLIGYDNRVAFSNVTSDTAATDYPITNVANQATNQEWRAANTNDQDIRVAVNASDEIDYVAIVRHNLGSAQIAVAIDTATATDTTQKVLLHLDGADASTTITDSNAGGAAKTWTANGNAQIDTAQSKFGGASLLCDGTGDYVSTPDHADLTLGAGDFTVDLQFNVNAAGGSRLGLAGQCNSTETDASTSWKIERTSGNLIKATVCVGSTPFAVTGTTQFTNAVNTGWHHAALVRTGNVLKLFIDGVQEGGNVAISGTVNDSANALAIGRMGELASPSWNGWVDEFRLTVGAAKWTANFTPPDRAHSTLNWASAIDDYLPADDKPLMFVFTGAAVIDVRIKLATGTAAARVGVLQVGKLLRMARGYEIGRELTPPHFARKSDVLNGQSHRGDYLGEITQSQWLEIPPLEFKHLDPDWYRSYFDPFVAATRGRKPFVLAWSPVDYPYEVAYVWHLKDPMPPTSLITSRIGVALDLGGIVE